MNTTFKYNMDFDHALHSFKFAGKNSTLKPSRLQFIHYIERNSVWLQHLETIYEIIMLLHNTLCYRDIAHWMKSNKNKTNRSTDHGSILNLYNSIKFPLVKCYIGRWLFFWSFFFIHWNLILLVIVHVYCFWFSFVWFLLDFMCWTVRPNNLNWYGLRAFYQQ